METKRGNNYFYDSAPERHPAERSCVSTTWNCIIMAIGFPGIFKLVWKVVKTVLLAYCVVFSLTATVALVWGYFFVTQPIRNVTYLVNHNPTQTEYMKEWRAELRSQKRPDKLTFRYVGLDSISRNLQNAVIAVEDDGFYTNPGFDIEAILAAAEYNKDRNKIVRGASTITQQLAKNLFCDRDRNFTRKFKEMIYTVLLQKYLGKERILELYLNYAQWGENIFGCEAASESYYHKSCIRLTLGEASRLASTLAMPSKLSPLNSKSTFIQKRMDVIANNMYKKHMLNDSGYITISGRLPPHDSSDDTVAIVNPAGKSAPPNHPLLPSKPAKRGWF